MSMHIALLMSSIPFNVNDVEFGMYNLILPSVERSKTLWVKLLGKCVVLSRFLYKEHENLKCKLSGTLKLKNVLFYIIRFINFGTVCDWGFFAHFGRSIEFQKVKGRRKLCLYIQFYLLFTGM